MTRLDLVTLLVADLERSKAFYGEILGLDVVKDSGGYIELAGGGSRLALFPASELAKLLGLTSDEGAERARGPAVVVSFALDDLDEGYETIVGRGAEPFRPPAEVPWGKRVAFVRDPDGNLVELYGA